MQNPSEAETSATGPEERAQLGLTRQAARVQEFFGDLELALLRGEDPLSVLSALKQAWREFRDAALNGPA